MNHSCSHAPEIRLLVCGSSHRRRGAGGWTDETWLDGVLHALAPNLVGHGASPSGGGDAVAEACADRHFRARGLDPDQHLRRVPFRPAIDGAPPRGFMARNARMGREVAPTLAIALCVGHVGETVGTRGSYLSNGTQNMVDWLRAHRVPVVVRRDDGLEPLDSPDAAYQALRLLWKQTHAPEVVPAGRAIAAMLGHGGASRTEVLTALAFAGEGSRFAPWIQAVAETVCKV